MKKAFVVSALAGFIGTFLLNDIKLLQNMGYEVHCAADARNKNKEENLSFFERIGVVFHQVDFSSKIPLSKDNIRAFFQLKKIMKKEKFDVIHCHTPIPGVLVRFNSAWDFMRKKTVVIYTTHGFFFHELSSKKTWLLYYPIEKIMSAISSGIITINNEDYHNAKNMWCKQVFHINSVGLDFQKYSNVDIDRAEYRDSIGIDRNEIMLLAVGELSERKNHQIIIRAMAEAKTKNTVLVICGKAMSGTGTYDSLVSLAQEKHVKVIFLGHRNDINNICHCADIGVLPSTREGFGMAGVEFLAAGIPVIASRVHGIKDYMRDGENGYLLLPNDVLGFASAIDRLSDKEVRDKMKSTCISTAKEYDKSISFDQMKKIYEKLLIRG